MKLEFLKKLGGGGHCPPKSERSSVPVKNTIDIFLIVEKKLKN